MPILDPNNTFRIRIPDGYDYAVWLDESGFGRPNNGNIEEIANYYSIFGGVLWTNNTALGDREIPCIPRHYAHGNTVATAERADVFRSVFQEIQDAGGQFLIFENQNPIHFADSNRFLYFRVLSAGITKLIDHLKSLSHKDSFKIQFFIAQKNFHLTDYIEYLPLYQTSKQDPICLGKTYTNIFGPQEFTYNGVSFSITMGNANPTDILFQGTRLRHAPELAYADLVSNARYGMLSERLYDDINAQFLIGKKADNSEKSLIISLDETGYYEDIRLDLSNQNLADAIYKATIKYKNLFCTEAEEKLSKNFIENTIYKTNYRKMKSCIKLLAKKAEDLHSSAESFSESGKKLSSLLEYIDYLAEQYSYLPWNTLQFKLNILIADCYLRSGKIADARPFLDECRKYLNDNSRSLDAYFDKWVYYEKLALWDIDAFNYSDATEQLRKAKAEIFAPLLCHSDGTDSLTSEYYGDAICMELLAAIQLSRSDNEFYSYETLCKLSDEAMKQYPPFAGELERHCQYRSFIEADNGNIISAIDWLIKSQNGKTPLIDYENKPLETLFETRERKRTIKDLIESSVKSWYESIEQTEDENGQAWYCLYYLLIIEHAYLDESNQAKTIGEWLYNKYKDTFGKLITSICGKIESEKKITHPVPTLLWKLDYIAFLNAKRHGELNQFNFIYLDSLSITFPEAIFYPGVRYYAMYSCYAGMLQAIKPRNYNQDTRYRRIRGQMSRIVENIGSDHVLLKQMSECFNAQQFFEASRIIPF